MRRKHTPLIAATVAAIALAVSGCSSSATSTPSAVGGTYTPVTVSQCTGETRDRTVTFDSAPQKIFTLDPQSAEFLIALGLGDRIVGTWDMYDDATLAQLPEYADQLRAIPVMGTPDTWPPSIEKIAASGADAVVTIYRLNIPNYLDTDRLKNDAGIMAYGFTANCTQAVMKDLTPIYDDITNLGAIFGRQTEAQTLIDRMQGEVQQAAVLTADRTRPTVWEYAGEATPYPAGGTGVPNAVITLGGGRNVFEDLGVAYQEVSWEQVVERNPRVVWLQTAAGPGFIEAQDGLQKAITSNASIASVDGVAAQRFVVVPYTTGGAFSVHAGEAVLEFAKQLVALS